MVDAISKLDSNRTSIWAGFQLVFVVFASFLAPCMVVILYVSQLKLNTPISLPYWKVHKIHVLCGFIRPVWSCKKTQKHKFGTFTVISRLMRYANAVSCFLVGFVVPMKTHFHEDSPIWLLGHLYHAKSHSEHIMVVLLVCKNWVLIPDITIRWVVTCHAAGKVAYMAVWIQGGGETPIWKGRGCSLYCLGVKILGSGSA